MEKKTIKILSDEEISKIETIDAKRIREIMEYSLFSEDEVNLAKKKDGTFDAACVITKMIRGNSLIFCWIRLKEFKSEIRKYLDLLPDNFKERVGDGYTFLSWCVDKIKIIANGVSTLMVTNCLPLVTHLDYVISV